MERGDYQGRRESPPSGQMDRALCQDQKVLLQIKEFSLLLTPEQGKWW